MRMFIQQLLNGVGIGCTYALIALGYNLTFGVLRVINLAYGEVFMASAFAALSCALLLPELPALAVGAAVAAAILVGLLVHVLAVRPLGNVADVNSPRHLAVIISTMGCSLVIHNTALAIYGANPQRFPELLPDWRFIIKGVQVEGTLVVNLCVTTVVMCLLYLLLNRTAMGLRIRALSENKDLALGSGIRASRDEMFSVIISASLAGVAAVLISQSIGSISPHVGLSYGLKGLVVLIVGGSGNMAGAVTIALLLGVCEALVAGYLSSNYRDAIAFGLLVILLVGRGLVGSAGQHR